MRVGLVSAEFPPAVGGVGDHTARLASELVGRGHAVDVLTSQGTTVAAPDDRAGGARVLRLVRRWDWRIFGLVARLARAQQWDVLHVQYQPGAYGLHPAITLLPRWLGAIMRQRPVVVTTFHDLRVPYLFPKAGPLRRWVVRQLARSSDAIVAVADSDLPALGAWTAGRRRSALLEHIPLGNHFDALPPAFDGGAWRAQLGLPSGTFLLGYTGFVNRSKRLDELVRALGLLRDAGQAVHLLFIGEAVGSSDPTNRAYLAEVRREIAALRLDERVHWTGYQPPAAVAGWLRVVDLAVLPFADGASLRRTSLIAAWSHGVPVLTTAPREAAPWLSGPTPVAAVAEATAGGLARAIMELQACPQRRRELAAAGLAFASRFAWPEVACRTAALYAAALGTRRR
jgi:glycosyltransferase involved in cell wall biosynthesis